MNAFARIIKMKSSPMASRIPAIMTFAVLAVCAFSGSLPAQVTSTPNANRRNAPESLPPPKSSQVQTRLPARLPSVPVQGVDVGRVTQTYQHEPHYAPSIDSSFPQQSPYPREGCPICMSGVDCRDHCGTETRWGDMRPMNLQPLLQGEYVGPIRLPAMLDYRIRVGDTIFFTYIVNREKMVPEYRLQVGDQIRIRSAVDEQLTQGDLQKGIEIAPDGKIYPFLIDPVIANGLTIRQLRETLEIAYKQYYNTPAIDITLVKTNTTLEDLRLSTSTFGTTAGGQTILRTVAPDGTIALPRLGQIRIHGMSLSEAKNEINLRYFDIVAGIEVEPAIDRVAPHFVYVYGEVGTPGRFQLEGPTSITQLLAMAGGVRQGGNNRQVVVFRRAEDWRLVATMLDIRGAHLGRKSSPTDEIWVRDSDLIIVPPTPVKLSNNFIRQVFTEGIYGVVPFGGNTAVLGTIR